MRKFCTKLVAGILFSILLSGVSFFGIAHAEFNATAGVPGAGSTVTTQNNSGGSTTSIVGGLTDFGLGVANLWVNGVALLSIATVLYLISTILAFVLALMGGIFDLAIHLSVYRIGDLFNNLGVLNQLWGLFRDAINVVFIFMLLYVAITMILGDVLSVKKKPAVTSIIVSALFINFSMFFAKILIDFGNIIAITLYNKILAIQSIGGGGAISTMFTANLQLRDLFGAFSISGQQNLLVMLVLQIGFLGAIIWAFTYGAFVFIGRTVALIFLVVTSPIAFVGSSIPWLQEERDKWWNNFTDQVIVAPIFMFFLLIVLSLYKELGTALGVVPITLSSITPGIDYPRYFYYVIMITLLLDGMKRVKTMSHGAAEATWKGIKGIATVGTALATGGVSAAVGKGLFAGGDMAAGRAALGGKNPYLARLANFGSNLGNLPKTLPGVWQGSKNGFKDVPGAAGMAVRGIQDSAFGAIKSGTGGMVDIGVFQKSLDKSTKDESDRIIAAAGKAGEKADAGIKSAKDTKKNILNQAEDQMQNGGNEQDQQLHKEATGGNQTIQEAQTKSTAELSKANEALANFLKAEADARNAGKIAEADKIQADSKIKFAEKEKIRVQNEKINKANERLIELGEETAKSMGIEGTDTGKKDANGNAIVSHLKTIDLELKKANESKILASKSRNETIAQLRATKGVVQGFEKFGLAFESDRKKLAGQMSAQAGKYNPKEKKEKELLEKAFKVLKEEDAPAETPAPTEPKA